MAKKAQFFAEAERLFVQEQQTCAEIATRLSLGECTVREWKAEGAWDDKRSQYLTSKASFHNELYEFARVLMAQIKRDMADGKDISSGRLYSLAKILPMITKAKDLDEIMEKEADKEAKPKMDPSDFAKIVQNALTGEKDQ